METVCRHGSGLPEEKAIVRTAVERGYVAVALGVVQQRKRMRCWANLHLPDANTDMNAVNGSPRQMAATMTLHTCACAVVQTAAAWLSVGVRRCTTAPTRCRCCSNHAAIMSDSQTLLRRHSRACAC